LPHVLLSLPKRERAFIYAAIMIRAEDEEKQSKKAKSKSRS